MNSTNTPGPLRAASACQSHIKSAGYSYTPEDAAAEIDNVLQIPEIVNLMQELVEEAKRDLANSPNWTGNTVRISKSHIRTLANIARALSEE